MDQGSRGNANKEDRTLKMVWALATCRERLPPMRVRPWARGSTKGKKSSTPKTFNKTWKSATRCAAREEARAAITAVKQVPIFAPNMKASAVGRVIHPSAVSNITMPVVALEE